jgi:hypothetical protein
MAGVQPGVEFDGWPRSVRPGGCRESHHHMGLRWIAAAMLEPEKQFRKVIGYTQLPASRSRSNADSTSKRPLPLRRPRP